MEIIKIPSGRGLSHQMTQHDFFLSLYNYRADSQGKFFNFIYFKLFFFWANWEGWHVQYNLNCVISITVLPLFPQLYEHVWFLSTSLSCHFWNLPTVVFAIKRLKQQDMWMWNILLAQRFSQMKTLSMWDAEWNESVAVTEAFYYVFNNVPMLSDMIRWARAMVMFAFFSSLVATTAKISAWWLFITDLIWAYSATVVYRSCVTAWWRWARVKITLHIHLTNWLYSADRGKNSDLWGLRMQFLPFKVSVLLYQLALKFKFRAHLPIKKM